MMAYHYINDKVLSRGPCLPASCYLDDLSACLEKRTRIVGIHPLKHLLPELF
jgi:hypothetical protein